MTPSAPIAPIQPDEGVHLRFEVRTPGSRGVTRSVNMEFGEADTFGPSALPDACERLLLDACRAMRPSLAGATVLSSGGSSRLPSFKAGRYRTRPMR